MGAQKQVKVISSSGPFYWYRQEIGNTFTVVQDLTRFDHWEVVEEHDGFLHNTRYILKADAEVIDGH